MARSTLGRGSVALAAITVQLVAFSAAYLFGRPTWYVGFALVSAALLGWYGTREPFSAAAAALGSVLLLALGLPLLLFAARQDPALVAEVAATREVQLMLLLTVYGPLVAALVSLAFGTPLAYLLAYREFPGQSVVESLVDLPLVVPHSVAGILILFGFGDRGVFPGLSILATLTGMVLALTFVSAPFAVNAVREAFESVDESLTRAARSQGASPFETFRRVSLPLAGRGVLTGGVLAWARGVSEFGAVAIVAYTVSFTFPGLGEVAAQHAPVFIYNTYTSYGLARSGAVAAILLAMSAAVFLTVRWLAYDDEYTGVV